MYASDQEEGDTQAVRYVDVQPDAAHILDDAVDPPHDVADDSWLPDPLWFDDHDAHAVDQQDHVEDEFVSVCLEAQRLAVGTDACVDPARVFGAVVPDDDCVRGVSPCHPDFGWLQRWFYLTAGHYRNSDDGFDRHEVGRPGRLLAETATPKLSPRD